MAKDPSKDQAKVRKVALMVSLSRQLPITEEEQDNPNRYGNARDAFEEARESGLSEEEAFEKAASAVGATEEEKAVAEAAFQQAIAEGADPREAVWAAEDAVREEFDRNRDLTGLRLRRHRHQLKMQYREAPRRDPYDNNSQDQRRRGC